MNQSLHLCMLVARSKIEQADTDTKHKHALFLFLIVPPPSPTGSSPAKTLPHNPTTTPLSPHPPYHRAISSSSSKCPWRWRRRLPALSLPHLAYGFLPVRSPISSTLQHVFHFANKQRRRFVVHGPATWESSGARGDVEWGDVCEDEQLGASQWDVSFFFFRGAHVCLTKGTGGILQRSIFRQATKVPSSIVWRIHPMGLFYTPRMIIKLLPGS